MINLCLFCGGDPSAPDHLLTCDGRQGRVEARAADTRDAAGARWPTFDRPGARGARDDALERVEAHAADVFMALAREAIRRVAWRRDTFIVDEVWIELGAAVTTHDKRAIGAAMQGAHRDGVIEPTDTFEASAQVQCHANPRRVWRSCLRRVRVEHVASRA